MPKTPERVLNREKFAPGTFGCHEALDRCSLLSELLDDFANHPAVSQNREWREKADKAADILASLYQEIGGAHLCHDEDIQATVTDSPHVRLAEEDDDE